MSEATPKPSKSRRRWIIAWICGFSLVVLGAIVVPNFIRSRSCSCQNACINNLRQIDGAKQQWALEKQKADTNIPTADDIRVYIKNSVMPKCPAGGTYIIGRIDEDPKCSIGPPNHVLPTP